MYLVLGDSGACDVTLIGDPGTSSSCQPATMREACPDEMSDLGDIASLSSNSSAKLRSSVEVRVNAVGVLTTSLVGFVVVTVVTLEVDMDSPALLASSFLVSVATSVLTV